MSAKKLLLVFWAVVLLLSPLHGLSQIIRCGSINYLYNTKGFKNFILGEDVHLLTDRLSFLDNDTRPDADSCMRYACTDNDILKIDSTLKLDMVGIRTYKNKIVNIYLFFDQKDAYKVLGNFLRTYGQYTEKPVEYADIYYWNTPNVSLSLTYTPDVDKGVAVFTFKPLLASVLNDDKRRQLPPANLQASNVQ